LPDGGVLSPGLSTKKKSPQRLELEAELLFRAEEEYTQDYSPGAWGVHSWSDDDTAGPQIDPDNLLARERLKWESSWAGTDDADAGTQATWFGALCRCLGAPTSAQAKPRRRYDLDRYSA
jgi:hypothetical protein